MNNVIYSDLITKDRLADLIKSFGFLSHALALLECLPQRSVNTLRDRQMLLLFEKLEKLEKLDSEFQFNFYTSGRIFDENHELRWDRIQGDQLRVVYSCNKEYMPEIIRKGLADQDDKIQECAGLQRQTKEYYLFGTRISGDDLQRIGPSAREGDFAQVRIQRILRYPLDPASQAKGPIRLLVHEFYDPESGQLELFRFVKLDDKDVEVKNNESL